MYKKSIIKFAALTPIAFCILTANAADFLTLPHMQTIAHPPYTIKPNTTNTRATGLTPDQVSKAYGFTNLGRYGAGQTIALIDAYDAPNIEIDLNLFNSRFGLPPCSTAAGNFQKIYADGFPPRADGDWSVETTLDVEWAHAMAPNAKILLVEASSSRSDALMRAVQVATQRGATVVSMSYVAPEDPNEIYADAVFKNNPNITFVAASGDAGHLALGVNYPAASPYVLSVGGSTLMTKDQKGSYGSESAWTGSGGGVSLYEPEPDYQINYPIPNNPTRKRGVPDVAYNANSDVNGFSVYDSYPDSHGRSGWLVIGGTSAGSPQWAAMLADANSSSYPPPLLKGFNTLLYQAAKAHYASDYHDITTGSNGSCEYYCKAQVGYDYVTGLGSPVVDSLVSHLRS